MSLWDQTENRPSLDHKFSVKNAVSLLALLVLLFCENSLLGQEERVITIEQAGSFGKDEDNFPGANILLKRDNIRVKLFHKRALSNQINHSFIPKKMHSKLREKSFLPKGTPYA